MNPPDLGLLCRAAFTFTDNKLGVTATGEDFDSFKTHFGPDDRGFGYIKIMVGSVLTKEGTGIVISGGNMLIDILVYGWNYSLIFLK